MNSAQGIHLHGTGANSGKKGSVGNNMSSKNHQGSQSEMQQTLKNLGQALIEQATQSAHASRERKQNGNMHSTMQFDMKKMARIGMPTAISAQFASS